MTDAWTPKPGEPYSREFIAECYGVTVDDPCPRVRLDFSRIHLPRREELHDDDRH